MTLLGRAWGVRRWPPRSRCADLRCDGVQFSAWHV